MDPSLFPDNHEDQTPQHAWQRFARVVVNRSLDKEMGLTYGVDPQMSDLRIGELVRVPLGRGSRGVEGVVVAIDRETEGGLDPTKIRPIAERLGSSFPESLVQLGRWISRYYFCPIGIVLTSMTPASVRRGTGRRKSVALEPSGAEPLGQLPARTNATWEKLRAMPEGALAWPVSPDGLQQALDEPNKASINRLVRLGLLREVRTSSVRARAIDRAETAGPAIIPALTDDQSRAINEVRDALGGFRPFLLFGVTGSGKTEVYLRVLADVLARGETGIVLVPEISLTPQTVSRFIDRFGDERVAVLHSALTGAQRGREWSRIASGEARVVVGARSAVFAPFGESTGRPGIIIVDEEHDTSYKQDQAPRYHARDVAIKRAQLEGCPVLLGSATPSLESWHNAKRGAFGLLRLPSRVGGGKLPKVEIVDLMDERRDRGGEGETSYALGPTLSRALQQTIGRGAQAMLLLNRRGFANYCCCADASCGWVLSCEQCDSSMVYHRSGASAGGGGSRGGLPDGYVRCHHCLAQQKLPRLCPRCSKKTIALGAGTQRVEEDLARILPDLAGTGGIVRVDSDSMRTGRDYFRVLDDFRAGRTRLLLGTQMIAKGLDFPDVELVGVISADTALSMPDFRASERTYQLVSQVAGRAGRSRASGASSRVIVQTMNADDPSIRFAAAHDFEGFAERELRSRREAMLPPVSRMARIVTRDEDAMKAEQRVAKVAGAIRALGEDAGSITALGPGACALSRLSGQYRFSLELFSPDATSLQRVLTKLRSLGLALSDTKTAVDIDPVSLL